MTRTTGGAADNAKVQLSRPRISSKGATFATVLVGPDEVRFVVHEAVLVHHSEFFRVALAGGFKKAQEKTVRLRDVKPHIFDFFVHWLYYQQFPNAKEKDDPELVAEWEGVCLHQRLVTMYIFAHSHCIQSLERQTLDAYFDIAVNDDKLPQPATIGKAFSSLGCKTALCRLLVDINCYYEDAGSEIYDSEQSWNTTFVFCVWQRYKKLVRTNTKSGKCNLDYKLRLCDYHDHKTDAERKACKGASTETSD